MGCGACFVKDLDHGFPKIVFLFFFSILGKVMLAFFIIQDSRQEIPVGEYLVPSAKSGTPFYFDFGVPILARLLIFELVGNISAMSDEEASLDAEGKDVPLPSSLSLMSKIRIYRYALGYEVSKWPQLSAV